jgi:hypothetical protein
MYSKIMAKLDFGIQIKPQFGFTYKNIKDIAARAQIEKMRLFAKLVRDKI